MNHARIFLLSGAVNGFLTVALGAFAAHALQNKLPAAQLATFETSTTYHAIHAIALLITGILTLLQRDRFSHLAGWAFNLGILLFCGSLYLLAVSGTRSLGIITPFGGIAFLIGWAFLATAVWRNPSINKGIPHTEPD